MPVKDAPARKPAFEEKAETILDLLGGQAPKPSTPSKETIDAFARGAASGDAQSQYNLAKLFYLAKGKASDNRAAVRWLKKAVEKNHVASLHLLGRMYLEGKGIAADSRQAIELFRKAAMLGNAEAQHDLGEILMDGRNGLPPKPEEALRWLRLAAAQGHTDSQYRLGKALLEGVGTSRNFASAATWLKTAAIEGYPLAQYAYARFFLDPDNPRASDAEALRFAKLAANAGLAAAQRLAGELYEAGRGTAPDAAKAAFWTAKAAREGDRRAISSHARHLAEGFGMPKDAIKAYCALSLLEDRDGDDEALLARLAAAFSPEDFASAQERLSGASGVTDVLF